MSRVTTTNQPIQVQPQNNIYTALAAGALVAVLLGLLALYMRGNEVFPGGLFGGS